MGNARKKELGLAIFLFFCSIYIIIYMTPICLRVPLGGQKKSRNCFLLKKGGKVTPKLQND